jgi:hypothetical protein
MSRGRLTAFISPLHEETRQLSSATVFCEMSCFVISLSRTPDDERVAACGEANETSSPASDGVEQLNAPVLYAPQREAMSVEIGSQSHIDSRGSEMGVRDSSNQSDDPSIYISEFLERSRTPV